MSWFQRLFGEEQSKNGVQNSTTQSNNKHMGPGLTGEYDVDLREKAGMHEPPPPPEYMGLEGEYDPNGLAKRIATALDQDPIVSNIETLQVTQKDGTVIFKGSVPSASTLSQIAGIASKVDGAKAIDVDQVIINAD